MNKKKLHYPSTHTAIIFLSLIIFALTNLPDNLPDNLFILMNRNGHELDSINLVEHNLSTASFIQKITAKSDADSIIISNRIVDEVHPANLEKTVRELSSFHTRHTESEFIDDVAYWLTEKLQSVCGTDVYVQNFTYTPEKTNDDNDSDVNSNHRQRPFSYNLKNLVCEKPGSTNNTIIISAHYDSRMENINNNTARAPGADDNASGVSALLEVARILSNFSVYHSIIFVLFSGEEQGKLGSTHYADYIDKKDVDLDLLINLDMVGFSSQGSNDFLIEYDNGNVVQDNDRYSLVVASFIKGVASKYTNLNTILGVLGNSDYLPFEALGYTVIGFHDDGVTKNLNHHTMTDTPDILNYEYLTSTTKLVLATILNLDKLITSSNPDYAPLFLVKIQ
ncbi:MAG: M20/M25/M40 family metallo-hydrolase [Nitrososphaeraceae archaeon]|nr:M20/M25/M40 family metallo-hydrolase [Nitrososphaeraceae archaeon]